MRNTTAALLAAACLTGGAMADVLHNNGPIITNPTGGTGTIAGMPISNADAFTMPGSTFNFTTAGVSAGHAIDAAAADDFTVPAGGWNLDSVTLFANQTSQSTATVHTVYINIWDEVPYSAGSPGAPDPLPQPLLTVPVQVAAGEGEFVCYRQTSTGTSSSSRPIFAYTISLDGLPNGGFLPEGTYWLEFAMHGADAPSNNVWVPLVSPRTAVTGHNARLKNSIDGSAGGPRIWFEGREGWVDGVQEGRAYELPFILEGTPGGTTPCYANCDNSTSEPMLNVLDFNCFLNKFNAGDPTANCDNSTSEPVLNVLDFNCFLNKFSLGCN